MGVAHGTTPGGNGPAVSAHATRVLVRQAAWSCLSSESRRAQPATAPFSAP